MPNPHGRLGAPMREPVKDKLREEIAELRTALFVSEIRREQAEERLKEIERALGSPDKKVEVSLPFFPPNDVIEKAMLAVNDIDKYITRRKSGRIRIK